MKEIKSDAMRKATLGGSVIAAVSASLCCIGPLAAVALGASGFAASTVFANWRWLFLLATFALLGLAWYLTYRKPKQVCAEGSACAAKPVARWNKRVLWLATTVAVAAAAFPQIGNVATKAFSSSAAPVVGGTQFATLNARIPTMECSLCANLIAAKVEKQSGVQDVRVSFDSKEAVVHYDASKVSREQILAVIDGTGYKAEPVEAPPDAIAWRGSLDAAKEEAKQTGKPILVDFFASWCGPCKLMDKQTWANADVIKETQRWITVRVDVDRNKQLAAQYHLQAIPTVFLLRSDASVISSSVGFVSPGDLLTLAREAAAQAKVVKSAMMNGNQFAGKRSNHEFGGIRPAPGAESASRAVALVTNNNAHLP